MQSKLRLGTDLKTFHGKSNHRQLHNQACVHLGCFASLCVPFLFLHNVVLQQRPGFFCWNCKPMTGSVSHNTIIFFQSSSNCREANHETSKIAANILHRGTQIIHQPTPPSNFKHKQPFYHSQKPEMSRAYAE